MKTLFIALSFLLIVACVPDRRPGKEEVINADSIIPEAQMILLLADVHTIEAALLIARNKGDKTSTAGEYYYTGLFNKYNVSRERYQQNLDYYRSDPDLFIKIYEEVNKELAKREKDFVKPLPD